MLGHGAHQKMPADCACVAVARVAWCGVLQAERATAWLASLILLSQVRALPCLQPLIVVRKVTAVHVVIAIAVFWLPLTGG